MREQVFVLASDAGKITGQLGDFARRLIFRREGADKLRLAAARGILEAIHWKPAIRWIVEAIHAGSIGTGSA